MANRGVLLQRLRAAVLRLVRSSLPGRCADGGVGLRLHENSFHGEDGLAANKSDEEK